MINGVRLRHGVHVAASGAQLSFQRPFKVIGEADSIPDPSRPTRHKIATRITANSAIEAGLRCSFDCSREWKIIN